MGVGKGLKPVPRGKRGSGKKDAGKGVPLNHLSPRGLVGFLFMQQVASYSRIQTKGQKAGPHVR